MKFLVFGGWFGSGNIGDDAILTGLGNILNRVFPGCELVALSIDPEQTMKSCGVESVRLPSPLDAFRGRFNDYYHALRDCDAVVVSGGTPIYDYGHISRSLHFSLPHAFRKKILCIGIGSKQLSSRTSKVVTRNLLENVETLAVRDQPSRDELLNIGIRKQVEVTGDSALFLETSPVHKKKHVIIAPRTLKVDYRQQYHSKVSAYDIERIRDNQAKSADYLSELGYPVCFLPMHCSGGDLNEIGEITSRMKTGEYTIIEAKDPFEVAEYLGWARLVLGLRLHSLIFAAMHGVPVLSVNYDPKIRGFMEQVEARQYLLKPRSSFSEFSLAIDRILDDRETGRTMLETVKSTRGRILDHASSLKNQLIPL